MNGDSAAAQAVRGPAIGLIVTGILNGFLALAAAANSVAGFVLGEDHWDYLGRYRPEEGVIGLGLGLTMAATWLLVAGFILYAGLQMSRLRSRELCLVASVLAMIPCTTCCCVVGIPMGLWALIVLNRPDVRAAFR
ncbi:MAG TPA: hypothetical protein VMS76_03575 [Planctomycetota bacterium]|nr:hypothetical protein [Planctomycetota bacterium]